LINVKIILIKLLFYNLKKYDAVLFMEDNTITVEGSYEKLLEQKVI